MNGPTNLSINKKNGILVKFLFVTVALAIFLTASNTFSNPIKNFFHSISYSVEKILWKAGGNASVFFASISGGKNLSEENENLKLENQKLLAEIYSLKDLQAQNKIASEFLSIGEPEKLNAVLCGVMGLDSEQDIISVDRGSDDGISEGMPVINQQNVLFGKVSKVFKNFSNVTLISNKNNVLDVKIQQDDSEKPAVLGAVKGNGGLGIYLDLVPVDEELKSGDILITSALEDKFPKNLLVGKITQVSKNDQQPFQQAQVEPFFNLKNTENLFVITNYKREKPQ